MIVKILTHVLMSNTTIAERVFCAASEDAFKNPLPDIVLSHGQAEDLCLWLAVQVEKEHRRLRRLELRDDKLFEKERRAKEAAAAAVKSIRDRKRKGKR